MHSPRILVSSWRPRLTPSGFLTKGRCIPQGMVGGSKEHAPLYTLFISLSHAQRDMMWDAKRQFKKKKKTDKKRKKKVPNANENKSRPEKENNKCQMKQSQNESHSNK